MAPNLDPRARQMLIRWADALALPREFPLGVVWGESRNNPDAVGDEGRAFGLLQMRADVWGWPGSQWQGVEGLERAIAALTPQWRRAVRPLLYEYRVLTWPQQVAAFARFWQSAQIADQDAVNQQAEAALRAGIEALITSGESTDHKVVPMTADISIFARRAAWAFNWNLQAEHDADSIAATLTRFGITALHQEAFYGLRWQGDIDRAQNGGAFGSPNSLIELGLLRSHLSQAGIALIPVFVPRGLAGEAELHAQAARLCGACIVDMESDSSGDYWPWSQAHQVRIYARALREACGPDVIIGWQPDSRLADAARAGEWAQLVAPVTEYVNIWLPQLYCGWGPYGTGAGAVDADERRFAAFRALGPVVPTLYYAESLSEPAALWSRVRDRSYGVAAFRFGAMDGAALEAFGALPLSGSVPEPVEPPPIDYRAQLIAEYQGWIAAATDDATRAAVRIEDARRKLAELGA